MKTTFKVFTFILLFSILLMSSVHAFGISMDLEDYYQNTTNTESENTIETQEENPIDNTEQLPETEIESETETIDNEPKVTSSTKNSEDDEFLTVENVLSIIIIVIGILLVLLAIAILIRFK